MNKKNGIKTTELEVEFRFANIKRDFDIIRIMKLEQETEDTKTHLGGYILDNMLSSFPALSVLYTSDDKIYCLYHKNTIAPEMIKENIERIYNQELSVEIINPVSEMFICNLAQLLCNSLPNKNIDNYHNISGALYYFLDSSKKKICSSLLKLFFQTIKNTTKIFQST